MSFNSNQRMFINKDVGKFVINESKTIRDAINLYGNNYGLPLIVINNNITMNNIFFKSGIDIIKKPLMLKH